MRLLSVSRFLKEMDRNPVDTKHCSDVVLLLLLRRDIVSPYNDVTTTLLKRRRLKDIQATS